MIVESGLHCPGAKFGRGLVVPAWQRPLLCRHFTAFAELSSLLFVAVSFQDSLTLEEPVKVLKGRFVDFCV